MRKSRQMKTIVPVIFILLSVVFGSSPAWARKDPGASVIYLRTDCDIPVQSGGETKLENCFTAMVSLTNWIYTKRTDPSAKLLIDVGPGSFTSFICGYQQVGGDLAFRGSGPDKTIISQVWILDCPTIKASFQDMTIGSTSTTSNAVQWTTAGGESTWTNVVLKGYLSAWYDKKFAVNNPSGICQAGEVGTHRFFSSRFVRRGDNNIGTEALLSWCGDIWIWGSEIISEGTPAATTGIGVTLRGPATRLHLYGSNIRVEAGASSQPTGSLTAIRVSESAELHSHGVGIDVIGKTGWTLTALSAASDAEIHANESAYFVKPDTGATFRRIVNNGGHVHAPYLWEHIPTFTFESVDGADMTTVTTDTSDNQPHLVIYSSNCTSGWYDTTDKTCRP